jgi:hypothetical protein
MVAEIVTSTRAVHDGRIRIVGVGAGARCVSALCKGMADEGVMLCTWMGVVAEIPSR